MLLCLFFFFYNSSQLYNVTSCIKPSYMLYKVPITYVVHMFLDYNYNSSMVQVTSLKIHSGNGGINRPVFNLRD